MNIYIKSTNTYIYIYIYTYTHTYTLAMEMLQSERQNISFGGSHSASPDFALASTDCTSHRNLMH